MDDFEKYFGKEEKPGIPTTRVIRNKKYRARYMHGTTCELCKEFLEESGLDKKTIERCSRHRYEVKPRPETPPRFWELKFFEEYED